MVKVYQRKSGFSRFYNLNLGDKLWNRLNSYVRGINKKEGRLYSKKNVIEKAIAWNSYKVLRSSQIFINPSKEIRVPIKTLIDLMFNIPYVNIKDESISKDDLFDSSSDCFSIGVEISEDLIKTAGYAAVETDVGVREFIINSIEVYLDEVVN